MAEAWYYVDDTSNAQQGPCTVPELGKLLANSSISDTTLVWRDGQAGWEALCSVSTLHAQVLAARGGPPALPAKALPPLPVKPRASGGSSGGGGGGGAYAAAQASAPVVQSMSGESDFVNIHYCSSQKEERHEMVCFVYLETHPTTPSRIWRGWVASATMYCWMLA